MTHSPATEEKSLEGMVEAAARAIAEPMRHRPWDDWTDEARRAISAIAAYLGTTESGLVDHWRKLNKAERLLFEVGNALGTVVHDKMAERARAIVSENAELAALRAEDEAVMRNMDDELSALRVRVSELEELGKGARDCGWQPIETAPKDGTPVLVYIAGARHPKDLIQVGRCSITANEKLSWVIGHHFAFDIGYPTHWMPSPIPPSASTLPSKDVTGGGHG